MEETTMTTLSGQGLLVRIFVGEDDTYRGRPLYEGLVRFLREKGLAGATVLKGVEGFGAHSRIHTARILRLSQDLPMVIETVDTEDRIRAVLPELESMIREGLITLERVEVLKYTHRGEGESGAADPD
jgi:hypothetical protein